MTSAQTPTAQMLFEVSWEVCNKVGGINTVLRSKLQFVHKFYPNYVLIGPAIAQKSLEFQQRETPQEWSDIFAELAAQGIRCIYGAWLAQSEPSVILIDAHGLIERRNDLKGKYWERFGIDSLQSGWEFEEPMCFSTGAGMLIDAYVRKTSARTIVQCHEWMAGFALLHLKSVSSQAASVFTTHATILGRTIMGTGHPLYDMLTSLNPIEWAYRLGVADKHLAEVACARECDVFTTVSEITGAEASHLLGRAPDVLLYNGFYTEQFPTLEETSLQHNLSKELLRELAAYTFFPHYTFDLDKTLFFFTSGRYEFTNKGMDVLIEALGRMNRRMRDEQSERTIVFFFWVISGRRNVRLDLLENKNYYYHVKRYVDWQSKPLLQKVVYDIVGHKQPGKDEMHSAAFLSRLHAEIAPLRREGNPQLVTHDIPNPEQDPVLASCRAHGLLNGEQDRVKVVLFPGYLDGSDGLLNAQYYDATVGAHLGVFPSHYEPWGYTPLESVVLGVPAVTTDLAGFGRYIQSTDPHDRGIFIIKRDGKSREEVIEQLTQCLFDYAHLDHEERVRHGVAAKTHAGRCSWTIFVKHYIEAHNLALARKGV